MIDDQDRRVLRLLQRDGRMSNQDLALAAGMSSSACWRRVKALEDAGIIRSYGVEVDARACGLDFHAIVNVQLSRHESGFQTGFIAAVQARAEVLDCFATTGESDYVLRVLCRDVEAYNTFLETFLFPLPGVNNVRTGLVLRQIKHETALPI